MTSRSFHRICFIRLLLPLSKLITRGITTSLRKLSDAEIWGNFRGILCALVGSFRFFVSLWEYSDTPSAEGGDGGQNQTENGKREDSLAANRRGAVEEGGMPVSTNGANFKRCQLCGSDPDKESPSDERHKGRNRVHRDADLAMIGVTPSRVHMGYLGDGQKRQQHEAQYRHRLQSARP